MGYTVPQILPTDRDCACYKFLYCIMVLTVLYTPKVKKGDTVSLLLSTFSPNIDQF